MSKKDPYASRPFQDGDMVAILAEADTMNTVHRDRSWDPDWMGRFVRVAFAFGMHVSVLSGGYRRKTDKKTKKITWTYSPPVSSSDLRREGDELCLVWRRPKTGRPVMVPIPREMRGWLPAWLDAPRPQNRGTYNRRLKELSERMKKRGTPIQINPLRFRHTAAVRFIHKYGMSYADTCELLGVTPSTLARYAGRQPGEVAADLRKSGW